DLVLDTLRYYSIEYILGDDGYMSEDKLNFYAEKYNIRLVFPIKSNTVINSEKSTALWNDNNRLNLSDIWNSIYHPRSNVESTFSSIKKSIGEIVWAKNETARLVEVYCKVLAYNIRLLILYYSVAGIVPEWINESRVKELISAHS
ncbi:MAG TPA: hypothetical protein O0X42_02835, partial [Methanocorpusculum sp.]|nr:hypothetical protein [Methanocorpusculum sp.]